MAKSQMKTIISVLRSEIGMSAKEFAQLIGKSVHTVKSLEAAGRLPLSEDLALKISKETGVLIECLLSSSPGGLLLTAEGENFSKLTFEKHRGEILKNSASHPLQGQAKQIGKTVGKELSAILEQAEGRPNYDIVLYRIERFLIALCNEFDLKHPNPPN